MRAVVLGTGAVGSRVARQLSDVADLVLCDRSLTRATTVASAIGTGVATAWETKLLDGADVLVVGAPVAGQAMVDIVETALGAGVAVVSVSDSVTDVESLLAFDGAANDAGTTLVVGAAMAPGLTDVLARHAAGGFEQVDEIHVAKAGTGGPACARQHHFALGGEAIDWRDGEWVRRAGGSGRELLWFPDPVGGQDCYRASLPDALLLASSFPTTQRITARMAATRRDRVTSALPMLRRPHPEGALGAVRVEVRGRRAGASAVAVLGAIDRPAVAAGAVAAVAAQLAASGQFQRTGAGGLASLVKDPGGFLTELNKRGVRAAVFEGSTATR